MATAFLRRRERFVGMQGGGPSASVRRFCNASHPMPMSQSRRSFAILAVLLPPPFPGYRAGSAGADAAGAASIARAAYSVAVQPKSRTTAMRGWAK